MAAKKGKVGEAAKATVSPPTAKSVRPSLRGPNARLKKLNEAIKMLEGFRAKVKIPWHLSGYGKKHPKFTAAIRERQKILAVVEGLQSVVKEQQNIVSAIKSKKLHVSAGLDWDGKVADSEDDWEDDYDD